MFQQLHCQVATGHLGYKKTYARATLLATFHWWGMRRDIEKGCKTCDVCAQRKQPHRTAKSPLQIYQVGQPMEKCALDIQGPYLVSTKGVKYILVVGDYFTKL